MPTLIVAEKNKAALAIAEALGTIETIKKSRTLKIYHVKSRDLYVIPLRGHLLEYKNVGKYKSWNKTPPRDIITDPNSIKKVPKKTAYPYIKALEEHAKICDHCIIGTDADIEGVNIGLFDAFPYIQKSNPSIHVSQLWLSSLQKHEILKKIQNLIPPKWNWGEMGEARAIIDAIIGFSATRQITAMLKPLLHQYNVFFISIGRVQTSLLFLIYLREQQINAFTPEPYFTIDAILNIDSHRVKVHHKSNPFKSPQKQLAETIYQTIKDATNAKFLNKKEEQKVIKPPTPLNTSKALILLTQQLKIRADLALKTLNSLYLKKIITYPRTDSDVYKADFDHVQYLKNFMPHSTYGTFASNLIKKNRFMPTKGKIDAGDHPPITPLLSLENTSKHFQNDLERKIYDLIARYYLALFGEDAIELNETLKVLIKEEPFEGRINVLLREGFLEIAPFLKKKFDPPIPIHDSLLPIHEISLNERSTRPPPRYSDASLLKLMEQNNLGTKATRPLMIEILLKRKLIYREKKRYFITELGLFLISNLEQVWKPFLEPTFTSYIEAQLEKIKNGTMTMQECIKVMKKTFLDLFDALLNNQDKLFSNRASLKNYQISSQKQSLPPKNQKHLNITCPYCKKNGMTLILTKKKKRFLRCLNDECKKTIVVPQHGKLTFLKTSCKHCGFVVIKVSRRKKNHHYSYYLCPFCWNEGLKETGKNTKKGFCSNCKEFKISKDHCVEQER
ncbi:MAG: DNA topoisomerase [Promethearchaeota archaeon]